MISFFSTVFSSSFSYFVRFFCGTVYWMAHFPLNLWWGLSGERAPTFLSLCSRMHFVFMTSFSDKELKELQHSSFSLSLSLIRYRSIRVILCGCNCFLNKIIKKNARQRKERMNDGVETFIHKKFASKWFIMPDSNAIELFVRNIQVRFSLLMHICCSEKFKWNELFLLEKRLQMIQWNFERNSPI